MSIQPKISVILPCYNAHKYLEQTLDSLRTQTFRNFEIIIVDDGSNEPDTLAFLAALESDIRVLRQENRGLPAARNVGFHAAGGEFVLPLDCDDWLEPTALEKLLSTVEDSSCPVYAFTQMYLEGDGQGIMAKNYNFFEQLFLNQLPYCILLRKSHWEEVGGYDESMKLGFQDWEFNIRLGAAGIHGIALDETLFHYRISQGGMLLSTSGRAHADLWEYIRRKHADVYRPGNLIHLWQHWRQFPSTYPLLVFFPWLFAAILLPNSVFSNVVVALRRFSHGRRVTAANRRQKANI